MQRGSNILDSLGIPKKQGMNEEAAGTRPRPTKHVLVEKAALNPIHVALDGKVGGGDGEKNGVAER